MTADESRHARRLGRVVTALGIGTIVTALTTLVAIAPAAIGVPGTVRDIAIIALVMGVIVVAFGVLHFIPAPPPASPQAQALARQRDAMPSRQWLFMLGSGVFYLAIAPLGPGDSWSWWLVAGGASFLVYGALLFVRERRKRGPGA